MSVVDVSRIPNNNKFDPVREAILQLEGIIESETAGVFSVNGQQGTLTIAAGANTSVSTSGGVITISSTASTGTLDNTLTLTAGDGITLSSPSVFDGSADVNITITNDDRPNAGVLTFVAGSGIATVGAADWDDEPQTWGQQGRIWSVSEGNTFSANELSDKSITLTHGDTSSIASSSNTNGVVIQSLGIDEFGHTQSIGTVDLDDRYVELTDSRILNWNEAYSWGDHALEGYLTSFTETDPTVGSHIKAITTTNISNWNEAYSWGDHAAEGYLTSFTETDPTVPAHVKSITTTNISNWNAAYNDKINSASFNTGDGVLTFTQQDGGTVAVDLDGRYSTTTVNNYVSSVTFSTSTGVLTLNREGLSALAVDLDGKYLNIGDKAADANLLDGLDSTYFLNYNNLTNKPTIPTVNNNTITVAAGGAMTGGGDFTVNQGANETITISHADTSSQGSVNNSGTTFIQDITLDTYGHVTFIDSASVTVPTVYDSVITLSAGGGLTGGDSFGINQSFGETITISHADTSAQGSVNNSFGTVIQDISLDTYGHITSIGSANLDGRYLLIGGKAADANLLDGLDSTYYLDYNNLNNKPTTTVANNNTITIAGTGGLAGGGSFTVNQSFDETIFVSHADTSALNGTYGSTDDSTKIDTITVDGNGHITAITTGPIAGGSGTTPTLDQVTSAGNISTSSISVFTSSPPSFALDVGGTIRASGDVIAFSDERVKENIVTIDNALKKLLQLRGVEYNKIGSEEQSIGVIAQEVEKILPQVVRDDGDGMKSVAYGNMVGLLIEAVKEQQKQIDELKAIINGGTK